MQGAPCSEWLRKPGCKGEAEPRKGVAPALLEERFVGRPVKTGRPPFDFAQGRRNDEMKEGVPKKSCASTGAGGKFFEEFGGEAIEAAVGHDEDEIAGARVLGEMIRDLSC